MSVTDIYAPTAAVALHWHRLKRLPRRILVLLRLRARRTRRVSELSRLNERLLRDLGIEPLDMQGAIDQRIGLVRLAMRHLDHS